MILEIFLFLIACAVATLVSWRKPKMIVHEEFELLEREIREWLRSPIPPSKVEPTPTADFSDWAYSGFVKPTRETVGQSVISSLVVSGQQEYQVDMN